MIPFVEALRRRTRVLAVTMATVAALAALGSCDRSATSIFAPPLAGLVRGVVSAEGDIRPPSVTLTLSQGEVQLQATTDAGGVYQFPLVAIGAWTLEMGALPTGWGLAQGQTASRTVLVVADEVTREDFRLVRTAP